MGKTFGCIGAVVLLPVLFIGTILFNSWCLQVIYNIGLIPIFSQFGVFLPQLGFWVFVLIDCVIGGIKIFFTSSRIKRCIIISASFSGSIPIEW